VIDSRIAKAEFELGFIPHFDVCIVNDDLATAQAEAVEVIKDFLSKE
jgi:guanylate kinase